MYICKVEIIKRIILTSLLVFCLIPYRTKAETTSDSLILQRVLKYKQSVSEEVKGIHTNVYLRYYFKTDKRNITLMAIPSMYAISRGRREYVGETYSNIYIKDNYISEATRQLNIGTIPHHKNAMTTLLKYLMPNIYDVTILDNQILSPFNTYNTKLYKYDITSLTDNRSEIVFRPKLHNTQMISGSAIVERTTGRIIRMQFMGEYDMVKFHIDVLMGKYGIYSLLPKKCDIDAIFHFIGNKIHASYHSVYDNPITLPDSIINSHDIKLMEEIRPDTLPIHFKDAYIKYGYNNTTDTIQNVKENKRWDQVLWDVLGDHIINRTKGYFGTNNQGTFRISPILNPLELSYSGRKGITYKLKINGSYNFSLNKDISLSFNSGYSFKQHQLYFRMPIRFTYNKRRNGYTEFEIGNGNRITNSSIVDQIKNETLDSINWDNMNLDYFKDFYFKFKANYDLSDKWSIQPGIIYHKRSAVDKTGFEQAKRPTEYYSFAPSLQIQFRPYGWNGPIFTTDYERGVKNVFNSDMEYERFEFDASWKKQFHSLKAISLRVGSGFYTSKSRTSYFLDYTNFREENIPGGWNDDWTGEFQLLNSNWYNASEYYVRTNATYESPLMLLSRIPYVGRLMEIERIYVNTLFVEHLHPYIECGYGFTNRFFSMGLFLATRNADFEGIGCRFGFELFRDW